MKTVVALAAVAALLASAGTALAHHSAAMFDRDASVNLTGVLMKYDFTAPHAWISLVVPASEEGKPGARWDIECTSAAAMRRIGITPDNLKPGDKITVVAHPLRDGRNGGAMVSITLANGQTRANTYADIPYGQLR